MKRIRASKTTKNFLLLGSLTVIPSFAAFAETVTAPALAQSESSVPSLSQNTHITGVTKMRSALIDEQYKDSRYVGLGVSVAVDHRIDESLNARLALGLNLDTGSSQSTFSDEYRPTQGVSLYDAFLNWAPGAGFDLSGGAIGHGTMESPLLIGDVAFPALKAGFKYQQDVMFVRLSAEQAIPTSDTTHSMPRGKDPLPTADFERVTLGAQFNKTDSVQAHVGHYAFNNLPSGIALESRFRGNSVTGVGDDGSSFVYDYSGIETGARAQVELNSRLSGALEASWLINLRAPLDQSHAMHLGAEASYQLSPKMTLTPIVTVFRSESDASPAYYNTASLAHSNRQGVASRLRLGLTREKLDLEGAWVKARVIRENPFQSDFTGIVFSLRKSYDLL